MSPEQVRSFFPALSRDLIFLENAGGSQLPAVVIDAVSRYLRDRYVQLGAGYTLSNEATEIVARAHDFTSTLMNADGVGKVVLGPSCSILCRLLADAYADVIEEGDEIVLAETGHEANLGPWLRLQERGAVVRWWKLDPASMQCPIEALDELLNSRTRLVALPHVSNLLGDIVDIAEVVRRAHAVGAKVVGDGVAYAPHRAIDVREWGIDWYVYSVYKVYGPHMAALFGTDDSFAELTGPNHFFVSRGDIPYKFELGGANHEGCAGLLALGDYLAELAGSPAQPVDREIVERAFTVMEELETPPQGDLVEFLLGRDDVRLIGPRYGDSRRVGIVSFVHRDKSSAEIAAALQAHGIAMRHGHMYAHRLCVALGLDPDDGVVRISLVHYNTADEIRRVVSALGGILG